MKDIKQKKVENEKKKQQKKDENVLQKRDIQERPKGEVSFRKVRKSEGICQEELKESKENQSACNNLLLIITAIVV